MRNFLLQIYFFNVRAASIIFFQSHHLENNFYPDFFFGAKTINKLSYMATYFVHISSLLFIVCAFFIRPFLAATDANEGHTTGNRQKEV